MKLVLTIIIATLSFSSLAFEITPTTIEVGNQKVKVIFQNDYSSPIECGVTLELLTNLAEEITETTSGYYLFPGDETTNRFDIYPMHFGYIVESDVAVNCKFKKWL